MKETKPLRVIGIDPGYDRLGVAIIEKTKDQERLLHSECFLTSPKDSFAKRLRLIGEHLEKVLAKWRPDRAALETLFFAKNQKTAMFVAAVRGVILYEIEKTGTPIFEYAPIEIKVAVTGYGRSDKKQVEGMVKRLIHIEQAVRYDDEYDAIAAALTSLARDR